MKKYHKLFRSIEKIYGVPAPVITAYWGLETSLESFRVILIPFVLWQHWHTIVEEAKSLKLNF